MKAAVFRNMQRGSGLLAGVRTFAPFFRHRFPGYIFTVVASALHSSGHRKVCLQRSSISTKSTAQNLQHTRSTLFSFCLLSWHGQQKWASLRLAEKPPAAACALLPSFFTWTTYRNISIQRDSNMNHMTNEQNNLKSHASEFRNNADWEVKNDSLFVIWSKYIRR